MIYVVSRSNIFLRVYSSNLKTISLENTHPELFGSRVLTIGIYLDNKKQNKKLNHY